MKTLEKIIQSSTTPLRQDVVWIDTSDPSAPVVKLYVNGQWELASNADYTSSVFTAGSGDNSAQQNGTGAKASGTSSYAEGTNTNAKGNSSHAEGEGTETTNLGEHAEGLFNKSNKASDTFGDAGNTIHSVGIGTSTNDRKNAFEIMQNGDAYLYNIGDYEGNNLKTDVTKPSKTLQEVIASLQPFIIESNQAIVVEDIDGHTVLVVSDDIYNAAKTAFLNGKTVLIKKIDGLAYHAVGYSDDILNKPDAVEEAIEGLALYNKNTGVVSAFSEAYALISESNIQNS